MAIVQYAADKNNKENIFYRQIKELSLMAETAEKVSNWAKHKFTRRRRI
jgi:NAD(P)H-hydrate repair Nnr-like enzyme with NAD(P)H-hydrate epimerase domain